MIPIILRGLGAILVGLGTLLWLWLLVDAIATSSDALGEALAFGYGFTATLFFCTFTLPAGIFVYRGRWLPLALVLAVIPVFVAIGFS